MLKFVALLVFCSVVYDAQAYDFTAEEKQAMQNIHDSCQAKTGANENDIIDFRNGKHNPVESLKCYMQCLFTTFGFVNANGSFDTALVFKNLPTQMKGHLETVFSKCDVKGPVTCEFSYNLFVCAYHADPEGLLVV